jgi:DNA-directed RNA polymerase subunit M/transcription elongation factor TFIIS
MPESKERIERISNNEDMTFVGSFAKCSICGKRKLIARQMNQIWSGQNSIDVYLECKDCAVIPL